MESRSLSLGRLLLCALCLAMIPAFAFAAGQKEQAGESQEPVELSILSHRVHRLVATEGPGGNIIDPFVNQHEMISGISWTPLEIKPLHDRLFREASGGTTTVDVGYLLNTNATPRVTGLLEPLDGYLDEDPIPEFEETFPAGMLNALTFEGKLYGIPMRAATHGLGWNEQIFNARGLDGPPRTPEQFEEYARQLTYTRDDGTKVYGFGLHSHFYYTSVNSLARMWGGGFINSDLEVIADSEATINGIALLHRLYEDEVIPPDVPSWAHAENQRAMEQGRIAMSFDVMGKITSYNKNAEYPSWRVAPYPITPELADEFPVGPANTEFWAMVIPQNAQNKDLSWDFIRHISTHESALAMALNGNGPTRLSVFEDAKFKEEVPYADILAQAQKVAEVPLPGFDKSPQAAELIDSYIERALLGRMEPAEAMNRLAEELLALSDQLSRP